jgi:hypothetical protein
MDPDVQKASEVISDLKHILVMKFMYEHKQVK